MRRDFVTNARGAVAGRRRTLRRTWWPPRLGEPLPRAAEAVGIHRKLETYSLVLEHSSGGPKAFRFAQLLSVTHRDVDHLAAEIATGVASAPVTRVPVTTGWELRYVGDRPRLVTAYVRDR